MHKSCKTKFGLIICINVLVLIEIASLFLMYKSSNNKSLAEVKLTQNDAKQTYAILIEQEDGTYKEQDETIKAWPTSNQYSFNSSKSGCIDLNGNKIEGVLSYDSSSSVATVDTAKTSYCYLYFDIKK